MVWSRAVYRMPMVSTDDRGREFDAGPGPGEDAFRYRVSQDESVSEAVVAAVASAAGRRRAGVPRGGEEAEALDPLYDVVDPDALDALFRPGCETASIAFTYAGHEVTVEGGDVVAVAVG